MTARRRLPTVLQNLAREITGTVGGRITATSKMIASSKMIATSKMFASSRTLKTKTKAVSQSRRSSTVRHSMSSLVCVGTGPNQAVADLVTNANTNTAPDQHARSRPQRVRAPASCSAIATIKSAHFTAPHLDTQSSSHEIAIGRNIAQLSSP